MYCVEVSGKRRPSVGLMHAYFRIHNFTLEPRFQGADCGISIRKYSQCTEI